MCIHHLLVFACSTFYRLVAWPQQLLCQRTWRYRSDTTSKQHHMTRLKLGHKHVNMAPDKRCWTPANTTIDTLQVPGECTLVSESYTAAMQQVQGAYHHSQRESTGRRKKEFDELCHPRQTGKRSATKAAAIMPKCLRFSAMQTQPINTL